MIVERLELADFRNYATASFDLGAGTTAVLGSNGQGKTNLAEGLGYLSSLASFRGAPPDAMVRDGAETAIIRATVRADDGRELLIEAELSRAGRNRVQVNRQRLARTRDLLGVLRVTVFSPDDLVIVKGGPSERRRFLDDTLVALAVKYDRLRLDVDRAVRQRNTLLKQAGGSLAGDVETTLDVWDARLSELGEQLGHARAVLVERSQPMARDADRDLAGEDAEIELVYRPAWREVGLAAALAAARRDDLRRGVSTVGPHRDDVDLRLGGMPARTHASQGEQRTLALALRLATHRLVADRTGSTPVLILDDVLSELDPGRSAALISHLPAGQVLITSASPLPEHAEPDRVIRVEAGTVIGGMDATDGVR